jgi:hypothetical protein
MTQTYGIGTKIKINGDKLSTQHLKGKTGTVVDHKLAGESSDKAPMTVFHKVKLEDGSHEHFYPREITRYGSGHDMEHHGEGKPHRSK